MSWTMRKRRRLLTDVRKQFDICTISTVYKPTGESVQNDRFDSYLNLSALTLQETEDVDRKVHPRNKASKDDGGPFFAKRLDVIVDPVPCALVASSENSFYKSTVTYNGVGSIISNETNPLVTMTPETLKDLYDSFTFPVSDLAFWGPKAFTKLDPTRDQKLPDIARILGELIHDGLPTRPLKTFAKVQSFKSLGSEYLNYLFGWRATIQDVQNLLDTYRDVNKLLAQLRKDNGQSVRRSGTLYYDKSSTPRSTIQGEVSAYINAPPVGLANVGDGPPNGPFETWTETETRVWYAGKGSYILPQDLLKPKSESQIDNFLLILDANLSPSTVYELVPWTWLIDWFSNIGSIVENAIGHGVGTYTADYCYLMRKTVQTTYYSGQNVNRRGFSLSDGNHYPTSKRVANLRVIKTTKERIAASPFGFGLALNDLSATQWAILTALGLSRQNLI